MKEMKEMNEYELLLISIAFSICDKISAAVSLYASGFGYNMAFFSSILAQEELAKLVMLPLIFEAGDIQEIVEGKNHIFFKHSIKQKLFTSYGLQNRTHEDIEVLKQSALYVGIDKNLKSTYKHIMPDQALQELSYAANLLFNFINKIILRAELSKDCMIVLSRSTNLCLGLISEKLPGLIKIDDTHLKTQVKMMNRKNLYIEGKEEIEVIITDPYAIVSLIKFIDPVNYKHHLKMILKFDSNELMNYILKISVP